MEQFKYTVMPRGGLASAMDATQLTLALSAGTGANFPSTGPFSVSISAGTLFEDPTVSQMKVAETVEVESRSGDTLTLSARDLNGNASPLTHATGSLVEMIWTPADVLRLQAKINAVEMLLADVLGSATTGVKVVAPNYDQLEVQQQTVADMTVKVLIGAAIVSNKSTYLATEFTTDTIVAPVSSNRVDLVSINSYNDEIVVTTGTEGAGTPSTPSGHCLLATILLTTAHTTIETGDITDARVNL
jgi:hypothetical protein